MSTPGLLTSHKRIRSSRHSSANSLSWSSSCSLSQGKPHPSQQMQVTCPQDHPLQEQAAGTSGANLDLPPPSWSHPRDTASGVSLGGHQPLLLSPARQPSSSSHGNTLPAVPATLALPDRQAPTIEALPQQPWSSPVSPSMPGQGPASSLQ